MLFFIFFDYHIAENRKIWQTYIVPLTQEQFVQKVDYSVGSIRNHVVHMMSVDDTWFCGLQGADIPNQLNPVHFAKRDKIRGYWDEIENRMQIYLDLLTDEMLFDKPFDFEEDENLIVWQVLLHIVNHGTDHRAQLLRLLNDIGVDTKSQDYIFYVYDNL
ncbi:MAG: DinB family protein [Chloroflexota bacterium]